MEHYEKLGAFYLGRPYDLKERKTGDAPLLYDSKDLVTHAICVGMTGSGKTGLCVSLLEEAAIDGIPALVIDPKGDLGNLLLTFPGLTAAEFRPWVNEDEARRKEMSLDEYAANQADLWRNGLASWDQTGDRIRRLRDSADFVIYTPGSSAGVPVSILSSFRAPPEELRSDPDLLQERISTTVTSLLGLLGIDADPIRSREHILLSTLYDHAWRHGQDLDLGALIQAIQDPPVNRVGVLDVESFYPPKDRFELAMRLNNLLAAPGFQSWMTGEPLDVGRLLYTPEGKPRIAIMSIAHLSESERMFIVSMLLNQTLGWMRTRPGTTSLRALLYMDEIFGFVPPTAEPPSKKPLLTMLKQGRAYGLGVVLATQNPVDLDYKGLSNTGTWFLGRLQTERDKMRVLEGLEGASAGGARFDRQAMEATLAGLGKRVFLMHNVHEDAPVVFHTRWAMSYLRGPLTREQIKRLTGDRPEQAPADAPVPLTHPVPAPASGRPAGGEPPPVTSPRPVLAPGVPQVFLPLRSQPDEIRYRAGLVGMGRVQFVDRKSKRTLHSEEIALLCPLTERSLDLDWERADAVDLVPEDLGSEPDQPGNFDGLPPAAASSGSYTKWKRAFADTLYRTRTLELHSFPHLELSSQPGESERDFRIRVADLAREERDRQVALLRKRYATRVARAEERNRKATQRLEREQEQASGQKLQTALSLGATLLSAVLGRKRLSMSTVGRATTTARGAGRVAKEKQDVERAEKDIAASQERLDGLNRELADEIAALDDRFDPTLAELTTKSLRPRRSDVVVRLVALAWAPCAPTGDYAPPS